MEGSALSLSAGYAVGCCEMVPVGQAELYCASGVSYHTCASHVQILSPFNRLSNFTVYVVGAILNLSCHV